ncbi:hypothetical protein C8Q80DRAFT_1135348 [Daedaleopsis nitida]|nr:hypothetical protein C8Q80DRAFT_1166177 [Daedaleopsis nitida]KAI0757777.1 hypothetical protein C8Q80DRAFT_1135348 [Daedaleopsis nitida]
MHISIWTRIPAIHTDYNDDAQATLLFPILLNNFPLLKEHIEFLQKNAELVIRMAKFFTRVSKKTRTDDLNRIKLHVYDVAEFQEPRLKNKCNRGWNSLESAQELVPLRLRAQYLANPKEFCRTLTSREADIPKEKRVKIYSKDWFVMMYDMTLHEEGLHKPGCLRNRFLVQIGKLLYTSFSSTDVGMERGHRTGKGQPPLAKTYKMKKINFHTILYITILARFAYTSYNQWCDDDGKHWNCDDFALKVLEFSHHNADWVDELEGWWTAQILGTDDDDDELAAEIAQTSFQLAIANECSGRRKGPPPLPLSSDEDPHEHGDGEPEDSGDDVP